jgi:transposase
MANKTISMIQIRRILQLRAEGFSKLKISQSLSIHRTTLDVYLNRLDKTGFDFASLLLLSDIQLSDICQNEPIISTPDARLDVLKKYLFAVEKELSKPGVTRKILWQEYHRCYSDGYAYTQFCEHFSQHLKRNQATMHFTHRAGEYLQIDFAGKQLHYIDTSTGEIIACPVLVCTLPCSGYTYVEALSSAKQEQMFNAMNRCLEYIGGVPRNVLSDNMKQFIDKNSRYEFKFQELASQWAVHYNTNLEATRPRKPKDKPSVENSVYHSYLRIYAQLRNEEFYSLYDLNKRIHELLVQHNHTPFQKLPTSRFERFTNNEKSELKALPHEAFLIKRTTDAKVQKNYHVVLGEDTHMYSVPYKYIGQQTRIIYDEKSVEVFIGLSRIAIHKRNFRKHAYSTRAEHMPEKHLRYNETLGWDAEFFLAHAGKIGENAVFVFNHILASKDFVEQTYNACLGLKRLSEMYEFARFEAACKRASKSVRISYGMIKNILENNLDKQAESQLVLMSFDDHENLRGASYYN